MPRRTVLAVSAFAAIGAIGVGPGAIWTLFGPADLGPIKFGTLVRRTSPNDALAAPPDVCPARSDTTPPEFAMPAPALRTLFRAMLESEAHVERVAADDAALTDRYVQRTALLRFPDTVVVQFLERGPGRSTLALYSRSQVGRSDFGVNRARIARWLGKLSALAPAT